MAKYGFEMKGDWRRLGNALSPKEFRRHLGPNIRKATMINGMVVQAEIKRRIRQRRYDRNAGLTSLLKGSSTPLVDDGDLFQAITYKMIDDASVFVGVLRAATDENGNDLVGVAELLHEGGSITVTEGMRNLFKLLARVGQGQIPKKQLTGRAAEMAAALGRRLKDIKPFKESTRAIVIPPRPFLKAVLDDPKIHKRIRINWEKAVLATFRGIIDQSPPGPGSVAKGTVADIPPPKSSKKAKAARGPANRSEAARRGWKTRRAKKTAAPKKE